MSAEKASEAIASVATVVAVGDDVFETVGKDVVRSSVGRVVVEIPSASQGGDLAVDECVGVAVEIEVAAASACRRT